MYFSKVYLKVFSSKVFILKTTIILKKVFVREGINASAEVTMEKFEGSK